MSEKPKHFKKPSVLNTASGSERMVGFELEFSGLTLNDASKALVSSLGGNLHEVSAAECEVDVPALGTFKIELDWDFLKRTAAEQTDKESPEAWVEGLSNVAAVLVPVEVVCPPIPLTDMGELNSMVNALRDAGAVGTEESPIAAYGVHINTEIPALAPSAVEAYVKAFALLQWWLLKAHDVNLARRVSPYIGLYPDPYVAQLLSRQSVSLDTLFTDYLEYNATRNRALDLLPLLAEIDEDRVRETVDDPKIKSRPAFHYRLPNCQIEKPDWSLAGCWNLWWVIEELVHQPDALDELAAAYIDNNRPVLGVSHNDWADFVDKWLQDHGLA